MISNMTRDGLMTSAPRCPQWWQVFAVRGSTGMMYDVYADDIVHGIMRCTCRAGMLRRDETCKHIRRVMRYGCLAGPDRAPGLNNLDAVNVSVRSCEHPRPRLAHRVRQRCVCGEPMLAPTLRLADDAGNQIVTVVFDDAGKEYGYSWAGEPALRVGDTVIIERPGCLRGTVIGLGSDWASTLNPIREKLRR